MLGCLSVFCTDTNVCSSCQSGRVCSNSHVGDSPSLWGWRSRSGASTHLPGVKLLCYQEFLWILGVGGVQKSSLWNYECAWKVWVIPFSFPLSLAFLCHSSWVAEETQGRAGPHLGYVFGGSPKMALQLIMTGGGSLVFGILIGVVTRKIDATRTLLKCIFISSHPSKWEWLWAYRESP